jgi:hypothetical protein
VANQMKTDSQRVREGWERAVERATNIHRTEPSLMDSKLKSAAGLSMQSGLKSGGLWGATSGYCSTDSCVHCATIACNP